MHEADFIISGIGWHQRGGDDITGVMMPYSHMALGISSRRVDVTYIGWWGTRPYNNVTELMMSEWVVEPQEVM